MAQPEKPRPERSGCKLLLLAFQVSGERGEDHGLSGDLSREGGPCAPLKSSQ